MSSPSNPDDLDKDIEAMEFLLDTIASDLVVYQDKYKNQLGIVENAKSMVSKAETNLRYLKREAQIVRISEFTNARMQLTNWREFLVKAELEQAVIRKQIKDTESEIKFNEKALRTLRDRVDLAPTAKILEFKK